MKYFLLLSVLVLGGCANCFSGDKGMRIATAALFSSSVYDAATTTGALNRGARELNPIARPFNPHVFALGSSVALTGAACWLKSVDYKYYKVPLWIGTGAHVIAGTSNLGQP